MKFLLDTGVWLWSIDAVERLNKRACEILSSASEEIYFSAVSSWEISVKASLGKLKLPSIPAKCVPAFMEKQRLRPLSISHLHTVRVYDLPRIHRDPFDRLLIAQAIAENMTLLTSDKDFQRYPVDILWCAK